MTDKKDALEIIYKELYEGKPERIAELEEARFNRTAIPHHKTTYSTQLFDSSMKCFNLPMRKSY